MGGLYSITTRSTGTVLTAAIYNADHQNHVDNQTPQMTDDYSSNAVQMQSTADPGESGSESLATSLAGELERLRFAIQDIKTFLGVTSAQWYSTPTGSLAAASIFLDSTFRISDNSDNTKKIAFEASGITTGTVRTLTVPDANLTIVGLDTTQTLTNKTVNLTNNTLTGTTAQFNAALSDNDFATLAGVETLTNKTISFGSNTVSMTSAQLAAALSDETGSGSAVFSVSPTFTGTITAAAANFSGAMTGTTLTLTKATAGDSLVWTNGGALNKTGYLYSDASDVGMLDVAGGGASFNGILLNRSGLATRIYANAVKVADFTSGATALTGTLAVSGAITTTSTGAALLAVAASTSAKYIRIASTGGDAYFGMESSVGGGFFTGSNAYETVLYSPNNLVYIRTDNVRIHGGLTTGGNVTLGDATSDAHTANGTFRVTHGNSAFSAFIGATKAIRLSSDAGGSQIEGVDSGLTGSYQPMTIGGSTVTLASSGSTIAVVSSGGVAITGTLSVTSNVTLGDAANDAHTAHGSFTNQVTANNKAYIATAASGGDQFYIKPQAAGSGAQLFSRNDADSAYSFLDILGGPVRFYGSGALVASVYSTGVYINTTSQIAGMAAAKLTVTQTAATADYAVAIQGGTTVGSSFGMYIRAGSNSSDVAFLVNNYNASTQLFQVQGDGTVTVAATLAAGKVTGSGTSAHTFTVTGSGENALTLTQSHASSANGVSLVFSGYSPNNRTNVFLQNSDSGGVKSTLWSDGGATFTGALTYGGVTLSNSVTGTGSMVLSASPTFTGTVSAAAATLSGVLTYGGVALNAAVTGTGNMVLSASPTFTGTVSGLSQVATEQATTSGTTKDFTSIPAGTKRITINFVGVSFGSVDAPLIQIGDSGGIETTSYNSGAGGDTGATTSTSGFVCMGTTSSGSFYGAVTLTLEDSSDFTWVASGTLAETGIPRVHAIAGSKSLSAELDRVRVTSVGGATFDAGAVSITYHS